MKSTTALTLAFAALLATAASAGTPARTGKPKVAKATTVCGTIRIDHVQCIRAPCPPLVFLQADGGKNHFSLSFSPSHDQAKASASLHHGARVCVTGHVSGPRMDNVTAVKTSKK